MSQYYEKNIYLNYMYYHKCIISFVFLNFKWLL